MTEFNALRQPIGTPLPNWKSASYPDRIVLHGNFCELHPVDPPKHARELHEANSFDTDGSSWTYLPYGPFSTLKEYESWMHATCLGRDPLFFVVVDKKSHKAVGVASYLRITPEVGTIEVGHVHFSPRLKRTQGATEAMYLMMKYAFELGYRRYEWKCDSLNGPSRAAAERLGFAFEGIFRQATIYKGRNRDTAWYSILDNEWPQLKAKFMHWLSPENFDSSGNQRSKLHVQAN